MNKLDNKGLTMIELIITIALISVVMVFLYRMLANVQYDKDIEFFASKNQEQKIEIINYMQGLLRFSSDSVYIYDVNATDNTINFNISDGKKYQMLVQDDKNLIVKDNTGGGSGKILRSWVIEQGTMGVPSCHGDRDIDIGDYLPVECAIPIYTVNNSNVKDNNNTIDDIMIAVLKRKK